MQTLKECDESELQEVSIEDLIAGSNTSRTFKKILQHEGMLELWSEYLDIEACEERACRSTKKNVAQNQENQAVKFDPDEAFQGICRKLRAFIKQRHFPLVLFITF